MSDDHKPPADPSAEESAELAAIAASAALAVADDLRAAFRSTMDVGYKRDSHDPVTEHDRDAEAKIRKVLLDRTPDSTVVGEEAGRSDGTGRVHWYVDPIDGTANFARGVAFFCTSIGAVVDDRIVAGAILDPMTDQLFTAHDAGAFLNGTPITSHGVPDEAHALLTTSYPGSRNLSHRRDAALSDMAELIEGYGTVRRYGSAALELAYVAAGWTDGAMNASVNSWDVCAGQVIVERAGGRYLPFQMGTPNLRWDAPGYFACTPDLDPVLARALLSRLTRPDRAE